MQLLFARLCGLLGNAQDFHFQCLGKKSCFLSNAKLWQPKEKPNTGILCAYSFLI